jgi:hypothetical protein
VPRIVGTGQDQAIVPDKKTRDTMRFQFLPQGAQKRRLAFFGSVVKDGQACFSYHAEDY